MCYWNLDCHLVQLGPCSVLLLGQPGLSLGMVQLALHTIWVCLPFPGMGMIQLGCTHYLVHRDCRGSVQSAPPCQYVALFSLAYSAASFLIYGAFCLGWALFSLAYHTAPLHRDCRGSVQSAPPRQYVTRHSFMRHRQLSSDTDLHKA